MGMSRSGSDDSSTISWAITSLAEVSSICTPRKMMRSSNILLYGLDSLTPYDVRSTYDGTTYRLCTSRRPAGSDRSIMFSSSISAAGTGALGDLRGPRDHLVDEPVVLGLLGGEPAVAVGVRLDLLPGLSGVERHPLLEHALGVEHLLGLDRDISGGTTDAARR